MISRPALVVVDRLSGEIRMAEIIVAVLGASSFTYARASWTQGLAGWLLAHVGETSGSCERGST